MTICTGGASLNEKAREQTCRGRKLVQVKGFRHGLFGGGPKKKRRPLTQTEMILQASRKVTADKAVPERKRDPEKQKELEKEKREKSSGPLGDFVDFYDNPEAVH